MKQALRYKRRLRSVRNDLDFVDAWRYTAEAGFPAFCEGGAEKKTLHLKIIYLFFYRIRSSSDLTCSTLLLPSFNSHQMLLYFLL